MFEVEMMRSLARLSLALVAVGFVMSPLVPPVVALAVEAGEPWHSGDPGAACQSAKSWSSRNQGRLPTSRYDCVHPLSGTSQELRVLHVRRGLTGAETLTQRPERASGPLSSGPGDESRSRVQLAGSSGAWSYKTEFELEREMSLTDGRPVPEGRSKLMLESALDLGFVRPRIEVKGSLRKQEDEIVRAYDVDSGSTSLVGGRAFLDLVLPHLPVLTIGAGREQKEVVRGLEANATREQVTSDVVSGALWYGRDRWQAYLVSSVYWFRDEVKRDADGSVLYDYYVSGSYWPTESLTISPSFEYTDASYDGRKSWIRTVMANVGVYSTGVWENGMLTLWGGYMQNRDTARKFDYQQVNLAVGAEQTIVAIDALANYQVSFGGSLGYSHYIDRLYPDASGPGFSGLLTLRISGL